MAQKVSVYSFLYYVLFFVCKFYRYQERDEIVNEQAIIEEIYERELVHESDYKEDTDNEDDEFTQLLNYS